MNQKEITITREYDASAEQVWKAWTDPELLKQWWGPDNVSIPECEVDLKVGGRFYIVMEAGEAMGEYAGTKWPMLAQFTEIEPNSKLSYSAKAWTEGQDSTEIEQTTEITLSESDGKTTVQVHAAISKTAGPRADMAVQGMEYGFNQQLDKLTGFLAEQK